MAAEPGLLIVSPLNGVSRLLRRCSADDRPQQHGRQVSRAPCARQSIRRRLRPTNHGRKDDARRVQGGHRLTAVPYHARGTTRTRRESVPIGCQQGVVVIVIFIVRVGRVGPQPDGTRVLGGVGVASFRRAGARCRARRPPQRRRAGGLRRDRRAGSSTTGSLTEPLTGGRSSPKN